MVKLFCVCLSVGVALGASDGCQDRINHYRSKNKVTPSIQEVTELHTCANRQATYDQEHGAHKLFKLCDERVQGEGGGSNCAQVIDEFYNERYSCSTGTGPGTAFKSVNQASEGSCKQACNDDPKCLSFDFVPTSQSDACRFFSVLGDASSSDDAAGRTYCKAGTCQGHCGPILGGADRPYFSWGVSDSGSYYTLNWYGSRPELPPRSGACPSKLGVVGCHEDTSHLWAWTSNTLDCATTCDLAGAVSEYKCDSSASVTNYQQVADLLNGFDMVVDSKKFQCQPGQCWSGVSPVDAITFSTSSSKCYFPSSSSKYDCSAQLGNANCYGDRFQQVCPCKKAKAELSVV